MGTTPSILEETKANGLKMMVVSPEDPYGATSKRTSSFESESKHEM